MVNLRAKFAKASAVAVFYPNILNSQKLRLFLCPLFPERKLTFLNYLSIMTKADIVNEVAKATGFEKTQILAVVEEFTNVVKGSLIAGEPVYLRGFGSFIIKHRAQKAARNITRKTTMTIPAHDIPAFKPAKSFVEAVKEK